MTEVILGIRVANKGWYVIAKVFVNRVIKVKKYPVGKKKRNSNIERDKKKQNYRCIHEEDKLGS